MSKRAAPANARCARLQLLSRRQLDFVDLDLALRDDDAGPFAVRANGELGAERRDGSLGRLHDETLTGLLPRRHLDKNLAASERDPAVSVELQIGFLIDIQDGAIRQGDAASLPGFGPEFSADADRFGRLHHRGGFRLEDILRLSKFLAVC